MLVETEKWYFNANVEILKTMGIELDEARYREIMINGQSAFMLAENLSLFMLREALPTICSLFYAARTFNAGIDCIS